jgi:hypothetical protein
MKKALIVAAAMGLLSCNSNTKTTDNFDWLIGNWQRSNEEAGQETFENWSKISPSEYAGIGFTLQNGDTVFQEKMTLIEAGGKWKFRVTIPTQKETETFEMSVQQAHKFVCTNDALDFPKRIEYWRAGPKLKARVANETREILFEFEQ